MHTSPKKLVTISANTTAITQNELVGLHPSSPKQPLVQNIVIKHDHFRTAHVIDTPNCEINLDENLWQAQNGDAENKVCFLFTGQGAQYSHMGSQLYKQLPEFATHLDTAVSNLNHFLKIDLLSVIFPNQEADLNLINQTGYTQPALFAIEYALAKTWMDFGVYPDLVMGHSVGEFAAATIAGLLSLEDGARLICKRAQLMDALPSGGTMAAIMTNQATLEPILMSLKDSYRHIDFAAFNGPKQTVISGEIDAVDTCIQQIKSKGIRGKKLVVSHAFHSSMMTPMLDEFEAIANACRMTHPKLKIVSNVTGKIITEAPPAHYWRQHVRQPVQFSQGTTTCINEGIKTFIEVGPNPVLTGMAQRCLSSQQNENLHWIASAQQKQKDQLHYWLSNLGQAFKAGLNIKAP